MQFLITQKLLGNQKNPEFLLNKAPVELDVASAEISAKALIVKLVTQQVADFNQRIQQINLNKPNTIPTTPLNQKMIDAYLFNLGKVDFNIVATKTHLTPIDLKEAIINTLQAFDDGLFVMFIEPKNKDYERIESNEPAELTEVQELSQVLEVFDGCHLSFVRLTFLAGGWF